MYRITETEQQYKKNRQHQNKCPFCDPNKDDIIKETPSFYILKNTYAYNLWDRRKVKKHFLLVPKVHTINLDKTNSKTALEYFRLLKKYSNQGYDTFTRSSSSTTKTQPHFHTHLIKTDKKLVNVIHFISEPYELFFK